MTLPRGEGLRGGANKIGAHEGLFSGDISEIPGHYGTLLIDPPWRFVNKGALASPEYRTMPLGEIRLLPINDLALPDAHLYLWTPNALMPDALGIMAAWGFAYKTNLVWRKTRKDGGLDGSGLGNYFRNATELILFGVKGRKPITLGARHANAIEARRREHSRKPDECYEIIEKYSPSPYLELFARVPRLGWVQWGDEIKTYRGNLPEEGDKQSLLFPETTNFYQVEGGV